MHPAPTNTQRIELIDVLRGFTLLGIIIVHFAEQYYAGQPPKSAGDFTNHTVADNILSGLIGTLISGKFFMIFSFLFGLSFFIQLDKRESDKTFLFRFSWRLIVLFLIGFVHSLHYRGDILTIYAVLGFVLLIFYRVPDKWLLIIALFLVFDFPAHITRLVAIIIDKPEAPANGDEQQLLELYYNTLKSGSYLEILKANLYEIKGKFEFQVMYGRIYITTGLFLLGLYAGRKRVFEEVLVFKKLVRYGWWITGASLVIAIIVGVGLNFLKIEVPQKIAITVFGGLFDFFNAGLATLYVSGIVLLFQKEKWRNRLMNFYSVGRMGLTTYLVQTVFGVFLFFSFGFGLLGQIGTTMTVSIAIALFIVQILFSNYWLKRYHFGPVEWLWRSLTYFKIQPFRK